MKQQRAPIWFRHFPPVRWLADYRFEWLPSDVIAGATLAAYAIPVSLAYAALAGLPPQAGIYGYLLGGLGYAFLGSSRQLAIGPTSAISLMIAGTVAAMADGDPLRYGQIASLAACMVALLCFLAWLLRLSMLVRLISDSILVGFKAGAGLTIAMTQVPSLLAVPGGGHNFFDRTILVAGQLGQINYIVFGLGLVAILLLVSGERLFPARPVALAVVALSIAVASAFGLPRLGVPVTGEVPAGLPSFALPELRVRDVEGIVPLAAGCLLLAYIENGLDSRQEFLGIGVANLAAGLGQGYAVAGGLSQSAVNDKAGARTPLALIVASCALALCLLFLTGLLANLPKAVLAAIVLTAIYGLIDFPAMLRMWRISRMDFYAAAIALAAVLVLGILQGILLAALASVLMLLARASTPHVAFLGRIPGTNSYSDLARHPENEPLPHALAFRPEASLLYVNADAVLQSVSNRLAAEAAHDIRLVVCDLSASPHIDLAGARMLHQLQLDLAARGIILRVVGARGRVRDLLRAEGVGEKLGRLDRRVTLDDLLGGAGR
ncbi:MAG: SulP family inorganic anion transporter [Alphaproteobacteria bacterium]|nr:MAG: SulP family inorganic anion transporter [Alphaproteobacteria bacterium]